MVKLGARLPGNSPRGQVVQSRPLPPAVRRRTLRRARVSARLEEAFEHRLTIVQANTGYGKSTELAVLAESAAHPLWLSATAEDADPAVFLAQLVALCQSQVPGLPDDALVLMEGSALEPGQVDWKAIVDALVGGLSTALHEPALLVIDDVHLMAGTPEIIRVLDRLVSCAPANLHVGLCTRVPIELPGALRWRVKGELLEIGAKELAFTPEEIADLFRLHYGMMLDDEQIGRLAAQTEGWPMALHLIWQALRGGAVHSVAEALAKKSTSIESLFQYLAQEVLGREEARVQEFLLTTAVLDGLTPAACDFLRQATDSSDLLGYLADIDLFVVALGDARWRYHYLFHELLRRQLEPARARALHRRAAEYYASGGEFEQAVPHLLAAGAGEEAARVLGAAGEEMIGKGKLDTLGGWIGALPPDALAQSPPLLSLMGDIARQQSRFEQAIAWYRQAEAGSRAAGDPAAVSRALRGQALVYLDTVRPAQAESLLGEALRLMDRAADREERAQLLELLAENKLNAGHPEEAERLQEEARGQREEGPTNANLAIRVLLRTGRINEARSHAEARMVTELESRRQGRAHRSHRETPLLLAFICAAQGDAERALRAAQDGMALAEQAQSPFLLAVAATRLGHAWLISGDADGQRRAIALYERAIGLGTALSVPRTGAEAQLGLCWAYGSQGDWAVAQRAAAAGAAIAKVAGDTWLGALIDIALGAGYVLARQHDKAVQSLTRAIKAMGDCSDRYGRTLGHVWLALAHWRHADPSRASRSTNEALALVERHGYGYLVTRRTLLGPPDNRLLVPLLLEARSRGWHPNAAARLLGEMGLGAVAMHPGYQLRIQTLGQFRVWRGHDEIGPREWRRASVRHLFHILITRRGRIAQRDELIELLWPEQEPDAGRRDFKVALSALCKALEPGRPAGEESAYVVRQGTAYGLRPGADIWLDAEEFERLAVAGDRSEGAEARAEAYARAVALYQGDYLEENAFEDWAAGERARLLDLYLQCCAGLAKIRLAQGRCEEAVALGHKMLARDRWRDEAYRLLMAAHARQGNRGEAARVYQAYVTALRDGLQAEPSPGMRRLAERLGVGGPNSS